MMLRMKLPTVKRIHGLSLMGRHEPRTVKGVGTERMSKRE